MTSQDTVLIAGATGVVGTAAANEAFNVTNGDALVWQDLWSSIADHFGMKAGDPQPLRLAEAMPGHEEVWARIVAKHSLQPLTLASLVGSSGQFTDRVFGYDNPHPGHSLLSPIKLRKAGFRDCEDTEDSLLYWLRRMHEERLLPR